MNHWLANRTGIVSQLRLLESTPWQITEMKFTLSPFRSSDLPDRINGEIKLNGHHLVCRFILSPCPGEIIWPEQKEKKAQTDTTTRQHELWKHTCFEIFLGRPGEAGYFELNVAPDGRWQCYQFDAERLGMRESGMLVLEHANLIRTATEATLEIFVNHGFPPEHLTHLKTGISVVIETQSVDNSDAKELHYYALLHPGSRPDFHCREAHTIQLDLDPI